MYILLAQSASAFCPLTRTRQVSPISPAHSSKRPPYPLLDPPQRTPPRHLSLAHYAIRQSPATLTGSPPQSPNHAPPALPQALPASTRTRQHTLTHIPLRPNNELRTTPLALPRHPLKALQTPRQDPSMPLFYTPCSPTVLPSKFDLFCLSGHPSI